MKNKKAEMGIGTLILFIAFILVAAVAASVLISTTSTLQSKALSTGKATTAEIGTSMTAVEIYSEDASDNNVDKSVDYFYYSIKLSSGSDPIRFTDVLLTMNTNNESRDYTYSNTYSRVLVTTNSIGTECNASDVDSTTTIDSYYENACSAWPTVTYANATYYNASGSLCLNVTNSTGHEISSNANTETTTTFTTNYGISYSLRSSQYTEGYVFPGDVVKLCFASPRSITEAEDVKFNMVPKVGSTLSVDTTMPSLMRDKRIYVYP